MNIPMASFTSNSTKGAVKFRDILLEQFQREKGKLALAFLCLLGTTLMEVLAPWPLKIIFDHILLEKPLPSTLFFLDSLLNSDTNWALLVISLFIIFIALAKGIFSYFNTYLTSRIGYQVVHKLRVVLFGHLQQLSLSFHRKSRTGELLTRITSDTKALRNFFTETLMASVIHVFTLIGMFVIMFALNWQLSLLILATFPVLGFTISYYYGHLNTSTTKQRKQEGKLASQVSEILISVPLVQAFGREGYEQGRIETASSKSLVQGVNAARTIAKSTRMVDMISACGKWAVVCFGSYLVLNGDMTPGEILIFAAYGSQLYKPIQNLTKFSSKFSNALISATRLSQLFDVEPEIFDHPRAIPASHLRGEIIFQDVTFGYRKGRDILKNASFHILAGQRVALVGTSGSGKSTIVNLLLRLYDPETGSIQIDDVNLKDYQCKSLRENIGLVLQEPVLFRASISENIAYGKPDATQEEIKEASRQAHVHDLIMSFSKGYDTIIGERGGTLSGGQRQRICLARALIKHPSIFILDEPTSAIDAESASLIRQVILQGQQAKTILFIAHQFSDMDQFDQILVLKNGFVVEHGPHERLLDLKGHYFDLVTA